MVPPLSPRPPGRGGVIFLFDGSLLPGQEVRPGLYVTGVVTGGDGLPGPPELPRCITFPIFAASGFRRTVAAGQAPGSFPQELHPRYFQASGVGPYVVFPTTPSHTHLPSEILREKGWNEGVGGV